eukprot:991662-Pyramimonas_sp.AAC.1
MTEYHAPVEVESFLAEASGPCPHVRDTQSGVNDAAWRWDAGGAMRATEGGWKPSAADTARGL